MTGDTQAGGKMKKRMPQNVRISLDHDERDGNSTQFQAITRDFPVMREVGHHAGQLLAGDLSPEAQQALDDFDTCITLRATAATCALQAQQVRG